jgi:hypothetical protein
LPANEITVRLEARHSNSLDPVFFNDKGGKVREDFFIMASVAVRLQNWGVLKINREPGLKEQF